jgi:hypothetical protein
VRVNDGVFVTAHDRRNAQIKRAVSAALSHLRMDLPSSTYLYTLAVMAMTFVGFTAIVMILRQSLGGALSRFDTLVARFFMAWGFVIAFFAMLPPLLAAFELAQPLLWRIAGIALGLVLLAMSIAYPPLRRRATRGRTPPFVYGQSTVGGLTSLILLANAIEQFSVPLGPAIFLAVISFSLAQASAGFIVMLNVMLTQGKERT